MAIKLEGNWDKGFAYDVHTLDSVYLGTDEFGHDQFKNTRSEMGELVFRLKYRYDKYTTKNIVDLLSKYKGIEKLSREEIEDSRKRLYYLKLPKEEKQTKTKKENSRRRRIKIGNSRRRRKQMKA